MTAYDPLVVERAILKALSKGGLDPYDCKALNADDAKEVSRRLIEIARSTAKP